MIVLDTDVVSNLMRPRPAPGLAERLVAVPLVEQRTTTVTLGELAYGAYRVDRPELYERAVRVLAGVEVLDFDRQAAGHYGRVRSALERLGTRLADPDLRIAATVLAHGGVLITGNLAHFGRVPGLLAEDWIH
ncbi:MAG: PIN domain-containing protein [Acidimicrobiales bacterium]